MNKQNNQPTDLLSEQIEQTLEALTPAESGKKPFVEPTVSIPVDVLESTTFFQIPTLDTSDA